MGFVRYKVILKPIVDIVFLQIIAKETTQYPRDT
jgi:hypothetical protein